MSKRGKARSGSMLLKFSNTSITSARASHARGSIDLSEYHNDGPLKRRKFFNSSTELFHVLGLMLMSFCRQVTSLCYLKKRLLGYSFVVLLGGIAHDFVPILPRALFPSPARTQFFNWAFVKYGWAWNVGFLLPLIALSAYALNCLADIELDKIEKSIEQYHERRLKQLLLSQGATTSRASVGNSSSSNAGLATPPKTIVTLQSISNAAPHKVIEQYQRRILNAEKDCREVRRFSMGWFAQAAVSSVSMLCVRDVYRLLLCSAIYFTSTTCFVYFHGTAVHSKANGNAVAVPVEARQLERGDAHSGLDISGHTFILIFSNLMFLEECNIMTGWEPLGDRLYDLSREYMNLELDSWAGPLGVQLSEVSTGPAAEVNRVLFLAWHRFHAQTGKLRVFFLLVTLLCLLWDLMLFQTAFFFHTLIEKTIALFWALACWFFAYRVLFPSLNLEVKKPLTAGSQVDTLPAVAKN